MPVASAYSKPMKSKSRVANVLHDITTQSNVCRIALDKLHFVEEHRITLSPEWICNMVAASAFDPEKMLEKVQLELKGGFLVDLLGSEFVNYSQFGGGASLNELTYGPVDPAYGVVSTKGRVMLDLHHELNGAIHDLVTGVHSDELDTFNLVLTFSKNCGFVDGQSTALPKVGVKVDELYFDELGNSPDVGLRFRKQASTRKTGFGGGLQDKFNLELGGINRAFMLSFFTVDAAGVLTPSDAILSKVTFKMGDQIKSIDDAFDLKAVAHEKHGGFSRVGCYVMDFGGDDAGWPDLRGTMPASLQVESDPAAPAQWVCMVMQDQVVLKEKFNP